MSKKLGKGLEAIFGEGFEQTIDSINTNGKEKQDIEIAKIKANVYQPRKKFDDDKLQELAESIKNHGVFQPILVRKSLDGYELVAGERRLRASKLAKLKYIPAIVVEFDDQLSMEIALLENIQRENLNVIEEAIAYEKLMIAHNYTQESLAQRLGKSRSYIANLLRLLKLPQSTQNYVIDKQLTMGHVRALLPLEKEALIEEIANKAIKEKLSVRALEDLVKKVLSNKVEKQVEVNPTLQYLQSQLQDKLQTSVKVDSKQIVIKYVDNDDLNRLLDLMNLLEQDDA